MRAWKNTHDTVTEYDTKQVEYWIRGTLEILAQTRSDGSGAREHVQAFLLCALKDEVEVLAIAITQGRHSLRDTQAIWSAIENPDGTVGCQEPKHADTKH